MFIVDAQVHIWGPNTPERPWAVLDPPYEPHKPVPFTKDDLLREMDAAGVQRVAITPPPLEGWRNDLALEAARLHPDRIGVMGRLDVDAPEAHGRLATWLKQPGMLGLRLNMMIQGNFADDTLWAEAEAAGVPMMLMMSPAHLQSMGKMAQRHPGLKLIVDQLAIKKGTKDEKAFAHLDQVLALAKLPNIAVKVCSLPSYTSDTYPYRWLHPHIRRVYDSFGPRRMFWGTDMTKMPCTYPQAITMYTEEIPWLSSEDLEWIMGRGLCEWISWKYP